MTWTEFRSWAWDTYKYWLRPDGEDNEWRMLHSRGETNQNRGRAFTGSGNRFVYGPEHQRRFAFWLRAKDLIDNTQLAAWLDESEHWDNGWLVNDGAGIRWVADPALEAKALVRRGFVAVQCGWMQTYGHDVRVY